MEAKQKELIRSLNNYVENERIINAGLSQIVKEENFEKNIDEILRIIATQLSSDRAYFGVFENPARNYHFSREWLNENVPSLKTIRDPRFYCQFGKWYERFANDELLIIPDIPNSQYAEVLKEPGCKTLMCAPIRVDRKLYGLLGIGFIRERREVSELDQSILRSAARLIALAKEHQLQREALDSLDRQNRIIFNTLPVPICLFNGKGELLRCNPAAAAFSNAAQTEMLQKPCYKSLCGFDSVPDICPVRHVLENGSQYTHEIETNGHDCLVTATPIRNREGAITHVLESAIDLTEINESKRQLEIAMRAAQAADRAKSYFLATMSHELRTPLNAVIGFSELLKGSHMSETEQKEALDAIQEAGSTLLELINDVLDLSKLEADKMDLAPEFLNVKEFLNNIAKIFLSLAKSKNLKFRLDFSETLPRQLKFDRKRLRQVLVNIQVHGNRRNHIHRRLPCGIGKTRRFHSGDTRYGAGHVSGGNQRTFRSLQAAPCQRCGRHGAGTRHLPASHGTHGRQNRSGKRIRQGDGILHSSSRSGIQQSRSGGFRRRSGGCPPFPVPSAGTGHDRGRCSRQSEDFGGNAETAGNRKHSGRFRKRSAGAAQNPETGNDPDRSLDAGDERHRAGGTSGKVP